MDRLLAQTRWALLSGGKGTGKSSLATRVAHELAARGVAVDGVVQEAILDEDGERTGYVARRVGGDERAPLARLGAPPQGTRESALCSFCSFVFDDDAFERARSWVGEAARGADVVVIDEVSKLEVAGRGHHDAIRAALEGRALVLLAVRADQLFSVMEHFGLDEPAAALETSDEAAVAEFVAAVARAVEGAR